VNYLIFLFAALLMMLMGILYYVNQSVSPPTPQACIKAGGQVVVKAGGKGFECRMPKEWWRF